MPLVRVKNKYQVVIPKRVRNEVGGVEVGDVFEATAKNGTIVLKPKVIVVVDRDEYTPGERRRVDAQLAKSMAEHEQGRSYGPFKTHKEMLEFLRERAKPRSKAKNSTKRRAH
jgi:AbrB family looped-hinge helix DNA binding protein